MNDAHPSPFRVSEGEQAGQRIVMLADDGAGTKATFVPSMGFACIAFRVVAAGETWNVLSEPPDIDAFVTRVGRYGAPIMFPWPNRIRDGRFTFRGKECRVPLSRSGPHASHGLTRERPWIVEAAGADERGAFCRASITIGDSPEDHWPFPARLAVEYRLRGRTLAIRAQAENVGRGTMPMGFGIHPWFDVPFGPSGTRGRMEIRAPARAFWELDETLCTTGAVLPVSERFDLQTWSPLADRLIDDVFTDLPLEDGWFTAEVRDPTSGSSIVVRSDAAFREHVVFAPLHSDVVCLEPYTCTTDAFNLAARGLDSGMLVLDPGQTWSGLIEIVARP